MAEGEEPDESEKTEEPTPKKLEDSRKKGQVALSREINHWMMLFAATLMVAALSPFIMGGLAEYMLAFIERPHTFSLDNPGLEKILEESFWSTMGAIGLPFLFLLIAAFLGPFAQVGPLFAPEVLQPKLSKISIVKGFKRIFSPKALVEFVKGIVKLVVVAVVAALLTLPFYEGIASMIDMPAHEVLETMKFLIIRVLIGVLVIMLIVAVFDYAYQRMDHYKKMRMTKKEVKDEYKTTEGDPHVKARLRQLRQEKARGNIIQAVPEADVVITNPTHYAVALKYDPDESPAPICVAKGLNEVALRIREIANDHEVVIQENPPLARALYDAMEVDDTLPMEHFEAVAKIISYVFQVKGRKVDPE